MFTPSDATLMTSGNNEDLELMHETLMNCFTKQKDASFPSPNYEGSFSAWASHIQKEQRRDLGVLIGEE